MPIVPLRDLGKLGVITDVDPFDLPIHAFSFAKNVRFEDNKVERGSVFRKVYDLGVEPKHIASYDDHLGKGHPIVVTHTGSLYDLESGAPGVGVTPTGWSVGSSIGEVTVTSCQLQNVLYVNRSDSVPAYRPKDALKTTKFSLLKTDPTAGALPGSKHWHDDWKCKVLRSMSGVLVALNVDKGPYHYGNMVKWSNFAIEAGKEPPDWDYASTTSNAGENTLAEMDGEIVDGVKLRNRMYIYGTRETWLMEFIGGLDMFRFDRAFDRNVINTNCVVENDGIHYVFGTDDLWMHDGTQDKSLATGVVRKFVFSSLRLDRKHQFFVTHNKRTNEVMFCYVSDDPYCKFPSQGGEGCNRGVIYNYAAQTFYFTDLPYVTASALVRPIAQGTSFEAFTGTFESVGGSFSAQDKEVKENLTLAGVTGTGVGAALRTFEPYKEAASVFVLDEAANGPALLIREGIDADELQAELRGYKLISSIYPQGRLDTDALPIEFSFGTYDHVEEAPDYGDPQTWDRTYYKLDFNQAGRYLAYKIEQKDFKPFSFSGFDFDVTILGRY